ncbi:ImmA/IrrE family metallo-endopeptidase [Chloroflexota bacterium]
MDIKEIPVNHKILEWARKEARLTPAHAATKARIKDLKARGIKEGLLSSERIEQWEKGPETPTYSQHENIAKAYRRPVLTFFLPEPPSQVTRLQDFRTVGSKVIESETFSPEFSAFIRKLDALQISLRDLLETINTKPLPFIGTINLESPHVEVAKMIRGLLNYSFEDQRKARTPETVFSELRHHAEDIGIFVLLEGNLGSYHTDFSAEVFRGLSISDDIAPFIVINPHDAKVAMIFTLIHELCHLLLGESGISNWNRLDISKRHLPFRNESYCDRVTAEFLSPESDILNVWNKQLPRYSPDLAIEHIARQFNVSRVVIARRLLELNEIDNDFYWDYFNSCLEEWQGLRDKIKPTKEFKIPLKVRTRSKLGNRLVNTVLGAAMEGKISELNGSRLLNVKINDFSRIM